MLRWEMLIGKALSTWLDQDEGLGIIKLSGQYGVYYYRKVNLQGYKVSHCCPMPLNEGRRTHVEVTDSRPLSTLGDKDQRERDVPQLGKVEGNQWQREAFPENSTT